MERKKKDPYRTEDGDNTKFLMFAREVQSLGKINLVSEDAPRFLRERIDRYFDICQGWDMKPSMASFSLALGTSRGEITRILNGNRQANPEAVDMIADTVNLLNAQIEDYMQNGKINPVAGIFLMKNNFGYSDVQQHQYIPQEKKRTREEIIEEASRLQLNG